MSVSRSTSSMRPGICTSGTRPTNPYEGQVIYETDTNRTLVYDNASWLVIADSAVLRLDSTNTRVGINNQNPISALDVYGAIYSRPDSVKDGIALAGNGGGTAGLVATLVPFSLSNNRNFTLPDQSGTIPLNSAQSLGNGSSSGDNFISPYAGFRNAIINGDFRINQRGFTSTTTGGYFFDRWFFGANTGTVTVSSQSFTNGSPAATGYESSTFARQVTSGQSGTAALAYIAQCIEDVRTFANSTVTISFWAKAGSGTPSVSVELIQGFGTGGSPSATVFTYVNKVVLSTSWTRYSVTTLVPNIIGKTIGTTANTSFLQVQLWTSAGSDFNSRTGSLGVQNNTFDFWGVQVERGNYATPFDQRTIAAELPMCQRYYYATGTIFSAYMSMNTNQFGEVISFAYPVTMRATPTLTNSFTNLDNTVLANTFTTDKYNSIRVYPFNTGFGYGGFVYGFTVAAEF